MLVDSHCHLTEEKFKDDLGEVIESANKAGVEKIIVPATGVDDWEKIVEMTKKYEGVYGLLGVHPEEVSSSKYLVSSIRQEIKKLIQDNPKIVGIGEIGLDFYWDKEKKTKTEQIEIFKIQLELAREMKLPVAIHSRDAGVEIREVFDQVGELPRGQFHCFGECEEFLDYVLEKGFFVSFCGNVTYESAENLRVLAKKVPLDRLLLETDAPYLSPEPLRGTRNEPKNVKITAAFLADIKGITLEELGDATTKNAIELFRLIHV